MRSGRALKRRRTHVTNRRMPTALVVEHLDVVEQLHLGVAAALESIGELGLDGREERFHDRIVVAIAGTTHTAREAVPLQHVLVVLARIGRAPVRVVRSPASGPRRFKARSSAWSVRCRSLTALTAHPTQKRENRSRIAARYSLPLSPILNSVVSPTHR